MRSQVGCGDLKVAQIWHIGNAHNTRRVRFWSKIAQNTSFQARGVNNVPLNFWESKMSFCARFTAQWLHRSMLPAFGYQCRRGATHGVQGSGRSSPGQGARMCLLGCEQFLGVKTKKTEILVHEQHFKAWMSFCARFTAQWLHRGASHSVQGSGHSSPGQGHPWDRCKSEKKIWQWPP